MIPKAFVSCCGSWCCRLMQFRQLQGPCVIVQKVSFAASTKHNQPSIVILQLGQRHSMSTPTRRPCSTLCRHAKCLSQWADIMTRFNIAWGKKKIIHMLLINRTSYLGSSNTRTHFMVINDYYQTSTVQNFIYVKVVQTRLVQDTLQQKCISTGDVHTKVLQLAICCQEED